MRLLVKLSLLCSLLLVCMNTAHALLSVSYDYQDDTALFFIDSDTFPVSFTLSYYNSTVKSQTCNEKCVVVCEDLNPDLYTVKVESSNDVYEDDVCFYSGFAENFFAKALGQRTFELLVTLLLVVGAFTLPLDASLVASVMITSILYSKLRYIEGWMFAVFLLIVFSLLAYDTYKKIQVGG